MQPTIALNQFFHPEHLRCFHCHKTVDPITTGLKERKGRIYCQSDYNALFLPKCQSCQRAVEKEAVISIDGKLKGNWHKYCFKCQVNHLKIQVFICFVLISHVYIRCAMLHFQITDSMFMIMHRIVN